jgi:CheY-like chemotaxis protein
MTNKEGSDDKKYVGILVPEETKKKWENFADLQGIPTISKLIRDAVNFYVDSYVKVRYIKDVSKFSHDIKEPLTTIKGYSQIILQNFSENLDPNISVRVKEIINKSDQLESKINDIIRELEQQEKTIDILIIEDDTSTAMVLKDFLQLKGFTSKEVTNGKEGLEEIKKVNPKLILLDIVLPDINGFEVCKTIKKQKNYKNVKDIPIYFITAIPEKEVRDRMEETGAEGYFLKPFDFDRFETLLESL